MTDQAQIDDTLPLPSQELIETTTPAESLAEAPPEPTAPKASTANPWLFLIIGLLLGGLAGYGLYPLITPPAPPQEVAAAPLAGVENSAEINQPEPHQQIMLAVIANARHFYGDPNAPITLVEFGDFNCGYCGKWTKETLPKIDEEYIKSGKVRMAYVHYPILGADSMTAAEASECAATQEPTKFWDYHNLLYSNQGIGFTKENLSQLAQEMGLDSQKFETCLDDFPTAPRWKMISGCLR
jgi:protein-disulfide isomerase